LGDSFARKIVCAVGGFYFEHKIPHFFVEHCLHLLNSMLK